MREKMPLVSEFVDEMRAVFGADQINASIKAGMNGEPRFFARENGHQIGTPSTPPALSVRADALGLPGAASKAKQRLDEERRCK